MNVKWDVIFVCVLYLQMVTGKRKKRDRQLKYEDCGTDPDRPIRIVTLKANPMPVPSPGRLRIGGTVNVTRELPKTMGVDMAIAKYFIGMPFKIPCINNIGTCHYQDVCSYLSQLFGRSRCPRPLRRSNIPCTCPFKPGIYDLQKFSVDIPRLDGVLSILAKGEYEVTVRVHDESNGKELGCLKTSFKMRKKKKRNKEGWFFNT